MARRLLRRAPLDDGVNTMTDVSFAAETVRDSVLRMEDAIQAATAPHVRMRPTVFPDGNKWCCLYGEDLMVGVAGFGDTPQLACWDFDRAWQNDRTPTAIAIEARRRTDPEEGLDPKGESAGPQDIAQ
jgi:hypothetical protein